METNPQLELAYDYVENTGTSLFLTGKAGTGKTTFLKELKTRSPKRMIVVAPTGVAAINAGGVTIHSFFQLPFGPYLPGMMDRHDDGRSFLNKFRKEKINIIRSLELLVIDEISMVRADLLDEVSDLLRHYRNPDLPFGGIQLLMIGDLYQLAPVVKEEEWEVLGTVYDSPYFFSSRALCGLPYVKIELDQVYRQPDKVFVELLNRIRDNRLDEASLRQLNSRCLPDFNPDDSEGYITLTTHNWQARQVNERKLEELGVRPYTFEAEIRNDFPDYAYPTEEKLVLKKGAQVMFVKNDPSPEKLYYNGKIGHISAIAPDYIAVTCDGEKKAVIVECEEWNNVRYELDEETQEIKEVVAGTFRQYPLKTAWAITVHKSQGLTLEKIVVDIGAAFAPGQVYVALSRCRTLEGLVLKSPLKRSLLFPDHKVLAFMRQLRASKPAVQDLENARKEYYLLLLKELFDFTGLLKSLHRLVWLFNRHFSRLYPEMTARLDKTEERLEAEVGQIGDRFQLQLERMVKGVEDYARDTDISERVVKGVAYFSRKMKELLSGLTDGIDTEADNREVRRSLENVLYGLLQHIDLKESVLEASADGFSVGAYQQAKLKAVLHEVKPRQKVKELRVGEDILHPELYEKLQLWRNEEARCNHLPVFTVLHQKAVLGIANTLPTSSKELLAVPGVGKKVLERYGAQILEIVDSFRFASK